MSDSQDSRAQSRSTTTGGHPQRISADGALLLSLFFGLGRTLQMVGADNDTYQQQLEKFWELATQISGSGAPLTIKIVDGRFFINELLCKYSQRSTSALGSLDRWESINLGGIEIPCRTDDDTLTPVLETINQTSSEGDAFEQLQGALAEKRLPGYRVFSKTELRDDSKFSDEERQQNRRKARSAFFQSIRTVSDASTQFAAGGEMSARKAKKTVNTLVDLIVHDESALVEMTAIKDFDDYTFAHSVNVCIYSLSIGQALNLDHKRLSQLGFAALFHDAGKVRLPSEVVKKAGKFDESDWNHMRKHPSLGVRALMKQFELESYAVRGAVVAYEHHMNLDFSGYPRRLEARELNLFSRIVTVADTFDALTSGRIYITERISPLEVMRRMLYQMNQKYDPLILKVFINTIGLFPPGSLVLLSDKRIAIIERTNPGKMNAPIVRIIGSENGLVNDHELVDLADSKQGNLSIVRYLDAEKCNIDLKRFVLEDPPSVARL